MIALFGGSFDPPHLAHEALVRAALATLPVEQVWVIPAGRPVHRELSGHATPARRLAWLQQLFGDEPRIVVKRWEIDSGHPVPTVETLQRFAALGMGVPLWLIGADAFAAIESWIGYPAHRQLCNMAVFPRRGSPMPQVAGWRQVRPQDDVWHSSPGHAVAMSDVPGDISATGIRRRIAAGEALAGLVNEKIRHDVETCYATGDGIER